MMPQEVPTTSVDQVPVEAVLLDVREDDEWAAGHAPQAIHIPLGELAERIGEVPQDSGEVYVVCRMGGRSARATMYLNQSGWDAVNVAGGMQVWHQQGFPLVAAEGVVPEVI
ncbi:MULTISPECIES: rhodanese-like domain-containing protein [unclassified Kutzneria]|jgi:rhodanese-related sulfurtransferase|uniref:rhodanese-like domain-containing protein n=1 Tax=unclassified Kutzneria TaxID=2621979 RepID=UPI0003EEB17A|nr:rhodanese-like domain-containing protein [Kutzneria sp. 744]EWM14761.1 hydroxyacylglutathione hydrolase [Kutzneria sp. 744]